VLIRWVVRDQIESIEDWERDWEAERAARKKALNAFTREVKKVMRSKGVYEVRNAFPNGGKTILHKSTRPGVAYQVTWIDNRGPSGHSDQKTLDSAIKRVWEDVHASVKRRFGTP